MTSEATHVKLLQCQSLAAHTSDNMTIEIGLGRRIAVFRILLVTAGSLCSGAAQATLVDRGGGLLYDTVLNVTWLQDANYAKTSGYDSDGYMNWDAANSWATNLVYHDIVTNTDLTGWRLPSNIPVGTNWNYTYSYNGSTDVGYNIITPASELGYMYYVNLGLKGALSAAGVYQPDFGVFRNGTVGAPTTVGLVNNLQSETYWSGTEYSFYLSWVFSPVFGYQDLYVRSAGAAAWAVRPGDVAIVPEPGSSTLLLAGLAFLAVVTKVRRQRFGTAQAAALCGVRGTLAAEVG